MATNTALAIRALDPDRVVPVVYDINRDAIEIGSAEDNHIVLSGPGVEPYHVALRQIGSQLYALVDRSLAQRNGESVWLEKQRNDSFFCPVHGQVLTSQQPGLCPLCDGSGRPLWLLRPLQAGDVFPIGSSFEASVLSQGKPNQAVEAGEASTRSPWPDAAWLANPPRQLAAAPGGQDFLPAERPFPFDDSNLWDWSPPASPFPVFMHQRVNRHVTRHASENSDREVGGVLLGQVYRNPEDGVTYPVISHAIAGRFATEARGHLTFTRETWLDIDRHREEHHPDKQIVGWYHTHPGFDIFLSEWDLFIHRHFFEQTWQVALVVDPHQDSAGFFVWSGGEILDPGQPHDTFRVADLDDEMADLRRTRVRIKLGERVP